MEGTRVYINSTGSFFPGKPVDNEHIDEFIQPINKQSDRIKRRILAENGIRTRHYAIDENGQTMFSNAAMAAHAVRECLGRAQTHISEISLLAAGTTLGDQLIPGFANMVQGELCAPPMETATFHGVCASGLQALQHAAYAVRQGVHAKALAVASEMPSRLFKKSRFAPAGTNLDFDAHFLRWMLSDGAGAVLLENQPPQDRLGFAVQWITTKSFAGDYSTCMQMGSPQKSRKSYLDYPSFAEAEADGAMYLRQDLRQLPHIFDVGVHEYVRLVREGRIRPADVRYFLCHYSSQKFAPVVKDLMAKAGLEIPEDRWFNNLATRGNTGCASLFVMLDELMRTKPLKEGDQVLCFVPESGRFTVGFALLEVVKAAKRTAFSPTPPQSAQSHSGAVGKVLQDLSGVWHDYRSSARRTPLVQKILGRKFTPSDYVRWMSCWIPQVREGSGWMREVVSHLGEPFLDLRAIIETHATAEQDDYKILFEDYCLAGGEKRLEELRRNPGGEALHAFMLERARSVNPVDLLGAIYIIEGTGSQIIPFLLPPLKEQLHLPDQAFRFLRYHGENDVSHLERWLSAVTLVLERSPEAAARMVETARRTSDLYVKQMRDVL